MPASLAEPRSHLGFRKGVNRSTSVGVLGYGGVTTSPEEDFVDFYEAHWPRLVAALAWSLPSGEDPRDVAQEAFVRAYSRWSQLREHPRPDAWLYLTAYRIGTSLWRRVAVRRNRGASGAEAMAEDLFAGIELHELLNSMPARQRAALLLRHYYGLSTRETAGAMGSREGTVKSLLARGREHLRRALMEPERDS
jgi:RNA polymerase sigma factor (sigma-70 family)